MCSKHLKHLIIKAREFDNGIAQIEETWKIPNVLVGRFAGLTSEAQSEMDILWNTIRSTQEGVKGLLSEIQNSEKENSVAQILQECQQDYDMLKNECDNLCLVLAEYGYQYDKDNSLNQSCENNEIKAVSPLPMHMENLEVEFTPDLNWKRKVNKLPSTFVKDNEPRAISTPISSGVASILKMEIGAKHDTPVQTLLRTKMIHKF